MRRPTPTAAKAAEAEVVAATTVSPTRDDESMLSSADRDASLFRAVAQGDLESVRTALADRPSQPLPRPYGAVGVGVAAARCRPTKSRPWFITSAAECTPSANIASLPVAANAPNLACSRRTQPPLQ